MAESKEGKAMKEGKEVKSKVAEEVKATNKVVEEVGVLPLRMARISMVGGLSLGLLC